MKPGLKEKLENYLQDMGGVVPYNEVRRMVEEVWESPKGGHYRMETLTRRSRKDNKLEESNERIGKIYNEQGVITGFFYKGFTEPQKKVDREFIGSIPPAPAITVNDNTIGEIMSRLRDKMNKFDNFKFDNFCCYSFYKFKTHDPNCQTLKVKENRLW